MDVQETITLNDSISGEEAIIVISVEKRDVGVCISLKNDGDTEVFLNMADCEYLIQNLQKALAKAAHAEA